MLRISATQTYHDSLAHGINDIQELSMRHEVVSKSKTELLRLIRTHYLPLYFPEIELFQNNTLSKWFFTLLECLPSCSSGCSVKV